MSLHRDYKDHDDSQLFSDFNYGDDLEELTRKKHIRRLLEDRLEQKRLKEELDDLDDDFDWDELTR